MDKKTILNTKADWGSSHIHIINNSQSEANITQMDNRQLKIQLAIIKVTDSSSTLYLQLNQQDHYSTTSE
jgi:hypothetical protein